MGFWGSSGGGGSFDIDTILPSAHAGSILFINGDHQISESEDVFVWDYINDRLGVGVAEPARIIDIGAVGHLCVEPGLGAGFYYDSIGAANKWLVSTHPADNNKFMFYAGAIMFYLSANEGTSPTFQFNQNTAISDGSEHIFLNLLSTILQNGTGSYTILGADITEFAIGSGEKSLIKLNIDDTTRFQVERGRVSYVLITATDDITLDDTHSEVLGDATSASFSVFLSNPKEGAVYFIKKIDNSVNTVTVDGDGATIDGASTVVLSAQNEAIMIVSDGTDYFIKSRI